MSDHPMSPAVTHARARIAGLISKAPRSAARIAEARRALEEAVFLDKFGKLIDAAPPLTEAQRRELADKLLDAA